MQVLDAGHDQRETQRLRHLVFPELLQESLRQYRCSRRKEPYMQEFVRLRIDSRVQPELLAVDSDHRLVKRDVIRTRTVGGL